MAASYNKMTMIGRLTKDPEAKVTTDGTDVCEFSVATSERYRLRNGDTAERVCFLDVVTWQTLAKTCGAHLKKGRLVFVEGPLVQDRWESTDGAKHSRYRVRADIVKFLDAPATAEGAAPAAAKPAAQSAPAAATSEDPDDLPF